MKKSPPFRQRRFVLGYGLVALVAVLLTGVGRRASIAQGVDESYDQRQTASESGEDPNSKGRRLREGSRIQNVIGVFRRNGDTATFVAEDGMEFGGLPNLSLERVVKLLKGVEEPESVYWSVSGEVTEFTGRNYLLIQRAVYKAAAPPPTPDSVSE